MHVIGRLAIGGAATQAICLTRELGRRHETLLVCGASRPDEPEDAELLRSLSREPVRLEGLTRNPGRGDLAAVASLTRLVRSFRPDVVHTHAAKGGAIGRVAARAAWPAQRPRLVHSFHGHVLRDYFSRATTQAFVTVERTLARGSDALVTVAPEVRDELVALRVGRAEQFRVIPVGIDLDPFAVAPEVRRARRAEIRGALGVPPEAPVVTVIGRLAAVKRVDRFLEAAALLASEHPDAHFLIVGDGPLRGELERRARELGLGDRVRFAGYRQDIAALLCASDVLAVTSDNEGTPLSVIEAQAAGLPVVATDVGGTPSLIAHGRTGMLVARDDVAAFARALHAVLADQSLAGALADEGRRSALAYSVTRCAEQTEALYAELLASRRPGPLIGARRR